MWKIGFQGNFCRFHFWRWFWKWRFTFFLIGSSSISSSPSSIICVAGLDSDVPLRWSAPDSCNSTVSYPSSCGKHRVEYFKGIHEPIVYIYKIFKPLMLHRLFNLAKRPKDSSLAALSHSFIVTLIRYEIRNESNLSLQQFLDFYIHLAN